MEVERRKKSVSAERPVKQPKAAKTPGKLGQNLGISMLAVAFVLVTMIVNYSGNNYYTENIVMAIVMGISIVLAAVSFTTIGIVVGAASIVLFAGFKIYSISILGNEFANISFLWLVVPVIAVAGMILYVSGNSGLVLENAILKKQISELVMKDPVTGLYNLRSLFMDIQGQISYSERNDTSISLMIARLRYPEEMKKVLKKSEYETVVKKLSQLLVDTVRLEDKVYSIDDNGGFGIILTCDRKGTQIVEKRLRTKLEDPKWFEGVSDKHQVRCELKIGYLQYDKIKYNRDASAFKEDVEAEVEYDV